MASLPGRVLLAVLRVVALVWLLVLAPLELATALAALAARPVMPAAAGLFVAATRAVVVATGLVLGRHLIESASASRSLAIVWAVADLGTLALVLATSVLPSNRAPGDAPWVWLVYAIAAMNVVTVASWRR